jgi:hypothetical protein
MAKYLNAFVNCHFQLFNYKNKYPYVKITIPTDYSFFDLIQIIKIYTNITNDNFVYDFYFSYYELHLSSKYNQNEFDKIKIHEYLSVSPNTICSFGPMKLEISHRYHGKWTKTYPVANEAVGKFPDKEEMKKTFFGKFKNITSEELSEYIKHNSLDIAININSNPKNIKLTKDDLNDFNNKLKEYFKNKYKISDETYIYNNNEIGPNKLILK